MPDIKNFVLEYAKLIATDPHELEVIQDDKEDLTTEITIIASKTDAGKLIGKDGNMVNALKTIVSACKAKTNRTYKVLVRSKEN